MKKTKSLSGNIGELATLYRAVVQGEEETVREAVLQALAAGTPATRILSDALIPAMTEVGRLFETHEYYLPELMMSSEAMHAGLNILRPLFGKAAAHSSGRVALGTVEGISSVNKKEKSQERPLLECNVLSGSHSEHVIF